MTQAQAPVRSVSEIERTFCSIHAGEELQRYCETCKKPMCVECIMTQSHKDHDIKKISEVASRMRTKLREEDTKVRSEYISFIDKRLTQCVQVKEEIVSGSEILVRAINAHSKHLTDRVEALRKVLVEKVRMHKKEKNDELTSLVTQYQNCKSLYETALNKISETLEGSRDDEIIESELSLLAKVNYIKNQVMDLDIPIARLLQFQKYIAKDEVLIAIFGELIEPKIIRQQKVEVITSFQNVFTDNKPIGTLAIRKDGNVWISAFKGSNIQLMNTNGKAEKNVKIDGEIADVSLTNNNDLLVALSKGETCLRLVKSNDKVTKFADMKPLFPLGIHVSKSGSIFVGLVDEVSYDVKPTSKRLVAKLDKSGAVRERYSQDNDYKPMFTAPYRIQENGNDDICVIDGTGNSSGRLVILTKAGKLKALYTGNRTQRNLFDPRAVCCTKLNNIIVCDMNNHVLHVLNNAGECLFYLDSEKELKGPFSINYNDKDSLWVGGFLGDVQCLRYTEG